MKGFIIKNKLTVVLIMFFVFMIVHNPVFAIIDPGTMIYFCKDSSYTEDFSRTLPNGQVQSGTANCTCTEKFGPLGEATLAAISYTETNSEGCTRTSTAGEATYSCRTSTLGSYTTTNGSWDCPCTQGTFKYQADGCGYKTYICCKLGSTNDFHEGTTCTQALCSGNQCYNGTGCVAYPSAGGTSRSCSYFITNSTGTATRTATCNDGSGWSYSAWVCM